MRLSLGEVTEAPGTQKLLYKSTYIPDSSGNKQVERGLLYVAESHGKGRVGIQMFFFRPHSPFLQYCTVINGCCRFETGLSGDKTRTSRYAAVEN